MWDPKPSDNIFPNKSLGIHVPIICQWFSFNRLSEVICTDQQPSLIPCCLRERSYDIQASLSKWSRVGQRIKDSPWLVNVWCKFLALVTLLHILLCFLLHVWPPVSLSKALWDKDLPPVWLLQIPSCNSFRSSSDASRCRHNKYGLEKERLYNFWSSDSQNWRAFLRTLSASNFSLGKISSSRNSTMESIQLGPTLSWWIWTISLFISVGLHKSSTRITRSKLCAEEVARVARESA